MTDKHVIDGVSRAAGVAALKRPVIELIRSPPCGLVAFHKQHVACLPHEP